jgi:HAD superfamily hydrolase (TIGR01509 family)
MAAVILSCLPQQTDMGIAFTENTDKLEIDMLKKAIFDMDGLIFDSERLFMSKLKEAMAEDGYILTEEIYSNTLGLGASFVEKYMHSVYGEDYPCYEMGQRARAKMAEDIKNGIPVKKGIVDLLEYFKTRNVKCVVASSTETKFVKEYLENAGLIKYFSELIGGEAVINSKPAPDIFLKALGDEKKENAVVLEDSENGVKAAINAGIPVICIPDMKRPSEDVLRKTLACVKDADAVINVICEKERRD